ncbi:hypothetical protein MBRA1_002586 [Malassezia brasiliensis]|uniref:Glutamyl-tRNA(Gln) amidotransferase subunit B, mitochondrial n=1 Tax=Malassezia brasiliensis TaxID=1821822 RepID=A0AAF0DUE1_9BASI|nr:hypothetical protein MBRA1_002586 [Malassezia brasiliensis]
MAALRSRASRAFCTGARLGRKALLPDGWEAVVGIECHAQLNVPHKLFSPTTTPHAASAPSSGTLPNTHVAPFDAGYPGTLPRLQNSAVAAALRAALALQCTIVPRSYFDRKHYFYADQPMGFQITQKRGSHEDEALQVPIEQVQLEQDTAKSTYYLMDVGDEQRRTQLLDFNRAGVALIEIVSAPAMRTPEQAGAYVRKVRDLLRCVDASDGNMNEGSLRCDVNVSIHKIGEPFGARCEIKNLNSVKFLMQAIAYEVQRQYAEVAAGNTVEQMSRGFDEARGVTYAMRSKEDAPDYRYLHEPNIPPLDVRASEVEVIRAALPELPDERHTRLRETYGLSIRDVNVLTRVNAEDDAAMPIEWERRAGVDYCASAVDFFEALVHDGIEPQTAVNWTIHHLLKELNAAGVPFCYSPVPPMVLAELIRVVEEQVITPKTAHTLLREMITTRTIPYDGTTLRIRDLIESRALGQLRTDEQLRPICEAVLEEHAKDVAAVRSGKTKALQKLVGAVMRRTGGRADAVAASMLLAALIAST